MGTIQDNPEENKMPLLEHLLELRRRLLYCVLAFLVAFFACYFVAESIYGFLVAPLAEIMNDVGGSQRMIYTALTEAFFTYIKVGAFGGVVVAFPIIAWQLWRFVAPACIATKRKRFCRS